MKDYLPTKKSKTELKFVTEILTPTNERDIFYQNVETMTINYLILVLVGLGMILYMVVF